MTGAGASVTADLRASTIWGPYRGGPEAYAYLSRYVNRVCGTDVGIVWASGGDVYPLRGPRRDNDGIGEVVVFQWSPHPPPPKPPVGFMAKFRAFLDSYFEQQGRAAIAEGQAQLAMGQAIDSAIGKIFTQHKADGLGVALDIAAIVVSLALLPTGIGALGVLGLIGGSILLVSDGTAYAMEMSGDEEGAEVVQRKTEKLRIFATILTLPDLMWGGFKAIQEVREARELLTMDEATAGAARRIGANTANADRAARLEQIAERAELRAQLRSEQIRASLKWDIAGRSPGIPSLILLIREEVTEKESALRSLLDNIQIHCIGVHK